MKATELRIGNIVWLVSKSKEWEILSGQEIDTGCDSNDFKPIPLTEEWLVRFGFIFQDEILNVRRFISPSGVYTVYWFNNDVEWGWSIDGALYDLKFGRYVHEAQNCNFALTGEELELKP